MSKEIKYDEKLAFSEEEANLNFIESELDKELMELRTEADELEKRISKKDYNNRSDYEYIKERLNRLKKSISEKEPHKSSPYFEHVEMSRDGGKIQPYFIGENGFLAGKVKVLSGGENAVAMSLNQNQTEFTVIGGDKNNYHYKLYLKRKVIIENAILKSVTTLYDYDSINFDGELIDSFLLEVLMDKRRKHALTDIIRTIQANQSIIIQKPIEENFIVQGCAGSGKTMVLLHRLSYLAYNEKDQNQKKWCVITPNKFFNYYIEDVCKKLHVDNIDKYSVEDFYNYLFDYILPITEKRKKTAFVSEKNLNKNLLTEIYSDNLYNKIISDYNDVWRTFTEKINDQKYREIFKTLKYDTTVFDSKNNEVYDKLNYTLKEAKRKILYNEKIRNSLATEYNSLKENLTSLNTVYSELNDLSEELQSEIISKINEITKDVKHNIEVDTLNLKDLKSDELKKEIILQDIKSRLDKNKAIDQNISAGEKITYNYILNNRNDVTDYLKEKCSSTLDKISELEKKYKSIGIFGFAKKRELKRQISTAKSEFEIISNKFLKEYEDKFSNQKEKDNNDYISVYYELESLQKEIRKLENSLNKNKEFLQPYEDATDAINSKNRVVETIGIDGVEKYNSTVRRKENLHSEINRLEIESQNLENRLSEIDSLGLGKDDVSNIESMISVTDSLNYENISSKLLANVKDVYKKYDVKYKENEWYRHLVYINLLIASLYYSHKATPYTFVSVDETQDFALGEIKLIKSILKDCVFNFYGDKKQMIYSYKGISDWEKLGCDNIYYLNENYRNTEQITDFCNKEFNENITAIGLDGKEVQTLTKENAFAELIKIKTETPESRCAVIYKYGVSGFEDSLEQIISKNLLSYGEVENEKISVLSAEMSKGLEFDTVIAITSNMTENEKYVSYTRALTNLIIIDEDFNYNE